VALAIGVLGTAATLLQPYVVGRVVGRIVSHHAMLGPFLLLVGLLAAEGVLATAQVYLLGRAGNSVVLDVRGSLTRRLLRAPIATHLERQRGDVFATMVGDTSLMGNMLAQSFATLVVSVLTVIGAIAFMAYINLLLTGVIFVCVVCGAAASVVLAHRLRRATRQSRNRVGEFGSALQRALSAVRTVKISRAEAYEERRIGAYALKSFKASMHATRLTALMASVMNVGIQASFVVVFTVGAFLLADGTLTTANFSAYLLYLLYLIAPLTSLATGVAQFQQGAASALRVTGLLDSIGAEGDAAQDRPATSREQAAGRAGPVAAGAAGPVAARPAGTASGALPASLLRFSDVTFGYLPGRPVLHGLSFDIPHRGLTAIVGPSGAGKSTVFSLIERFWDVNSGAITLDGTDIRTMPLSELRCRIGYVEQDAPAMGGSLRENLLYACPDASQAELDEVIDLASLRGWVTGLPEGLNTQLGEGGAAISGGERQRIAIARMMLARPDLLLLDEATSQLDAESSAVLHAAVARIAVRCAVITIAHQAGPAAAADRVLVLERGTLRAQGTHDVLLATDELYRRFVHARSFQLAAAGFDAAPGPGRAEGQPWRAAMTVTDPQYAGRRSSGMTEDAASQNGNPD
jgi:ABC-type multidrug transport system fused ATPase/permease subunit